MLVFIDDSGDAGFKIDKGAARFFVIALIIFDDYLEAKKQPLAGMSPTLYPIPVVPVTPPSGDSSEYRFL